MTFCEAPHATIHSALKAPISGTHVNEVMGETQGDGYGTRPRRGFGKKWCPPPPPEGEVFRTDLNRHITPVAPCGV